MARRRMIDPNFWQSEDVSKLNIRQRLLFIGLFSNADDEGKLRGNPAFIRSAIFPYEDFTLGEIERDLKCISEIKSIVQYEVNSNSYIKIVNWFKFQRVDKPQISVIPNPVIVENNHSENDSKNEYKNESCLKEVKGNEVSIKEEYIHIEDMPHVKITKVEFDKLVVLLGNEKKVSDKLYYFASWILGQPEKKRKSASPYLSITAWHKRDLEKVVPIGNNDREAQNAKRLAEERKTQSKIEYAPSNDEVINFGK